MQRSRPDGSAAGPAGASTASDRMPHTEQEASDGESDAFGRRAVVRLAVETLVHAVVAVLSRRWGRQESLWVFGARGGDAFVDNAKYLYLEAVAHRDDVRPVWLSRDREVVERLQAAGYEAYHAYSLYGTYFSLRAGVVCLTQDHRDVNLACSGGADVAQLWHGIPLKHVGWDAELPSRPLLARLCLRYLQGTTSLFVLTARSLSAVFASGLGIDQDRMVVAGYPRTEALVRAVSGEEIGVDEDVQDRLDRAAGAGPLLFYLPTFREFDAGGFVDHLDLDALERFLAEHDAHVAVKPHPKESVDLDRQTGSRVVEVPPDTDVYPLVRRADVLLTDYSSVLFDFLLVDRPVVFYPYDLDRYRGERGFYFDYDSVTPGPVARDVGDLLAALEDVLDGDEFAAERAAVRDRFFDAYEGDRRARTYRVLANRFGPQ